MLSLAHKRLDVWKIGIDLVSKIYTLTSDFPSSERYGITNQLRRASISVPSNIAEGSARSSRTESKRFYEIARGSLVEIDTQLEIAINLQFCSKEDIRSISEMMNRLFALLSGLIKSVSK